MRKVLVALIPVVTFWSPHPRQETTVTGRLPAWASRRHAGRGFRPSRFYYPSIQIHRASAERREVI